MTLETIAPLSDDPIVSLPAVASLTNPAHAGDRGDHTASYTTSWDTILGSGEDLPLPISETGSAVSATKRWLRTRYDRACQGRTAWFTAAFRVNDV